MKKCLIVLLISALILVFASDSFAAVEKKKEAPAKKPEEVRPRGFAIKGGLMGGAGVAAIGYVFPIRAFNAGVYAGYGIGNKYNATVAQLEGIFKLKAMNVVLSVDYANYSEMVRNLPGLPGDTTKGAHAGIGLSLGREFGKWEARLGYSTALGLTATAGYKF